MEPEPEGVRLAELVATISLGTDLGLGLPMEHIIRTTLIALRLADLVGLEEQERSVAYYSGLLAWVGCHTDAYEQAKWFGDDIAMKRDGRWYDVGRPSQAAAMALHGVGMGRPAWVRAKTLAALPMAFRRNAMVDLHNHWVGADLLAERLGLGTDVRQSLKESFERWDGKGMMGSAGEEIRFTSRLVILADVMAAYLAEEGIEAAAAVARERSGTQFDPRLVDLFCEHAGELVAGIEVGAGWQTVLAAEPGLGHVLAPEELDAALEAVGDFADLKSPYTIGHSRSVANLAGDAATALGLPDAHDVRQAGLVHDLGRLGVSNAVWDKSEPLTVAEQERVRLHPYLTERMLAGTPALARLGAIAVQHHERLDGSGYPRGLSGRAISAAGRVLGAADAYATMVEPRPHRPATHPDRAAATLREQVEVGRIDADAAEAVLEAAGHRGRRWRTWPAGLTAREVEVLGLVAQGLSTKEIAERLVISRRTAGAHIEHIYAKTGATNRATASMFAMRHGLMAL